MIEKDDLVKYVTNVHARTYEAVQRLDDSHLHWRPAPGEFTAAELVMHIINTRLMNLEGIQQKRQRYRGHAVPAGAAAHDLERRLLRSGKKVIAGMAGADLEAIIPNLAGDAFPGWRRVIGGLIEHEVHHRSQLCSYLTGMGIEPPPLYGLHAEDLPR